MSPSDLIAAVTGHSSGGVLSSHAWRGDATVVLRREALVETARFLKEDPALRFDFLMDLTAVDWSAFGRSPAPAFFASSGVGLRPPQQVQDEDPWPGPPGPERFAVVCHLYSREHRHRIRLVVPLAAGDAEVDTLTGLWPGAAWLEREAWDMFGIRFRGHPDLRRILMYEEFEGHPLRKDYPVSKRQPLIGPAT